MRNEKVTQPSLSLVVGTLYRLTVIKKEMLNVFLPFNSFLTMF